MPSVYIQARPYDVHFSAETKYQYYSTVVKFLCTYRIKTNLESMK